MLQFQSKDDLEDKLSQLTELIKNECKPSNPNKDALKADLKIIYEYLEEIENCDKATSEADILVQKIENVNITNTKNRKEFREV